MKKPRQNRNFTRQVSSFVSSVKLIKLFLIVKIVGFHHFCYSSHPCIFPSLAVILGAKNPPAGEVAEEGIADCIAVIQLNILWMVATSNKPPILDGYINPYKQWDVYHLSSSIIYPLQGVLLSSSSINWWFGFRNHRSWRTAPCVKLDRLDCASSWNCSTAKRSLG